MWNTKPSKHLEKKEEKLQDLGLHQKFIDLTHKAWSTKGKNHELDHTQIKIFYTVKDPVKKMKRQSIYCKKIFSNNVCEEKSNYLQYIF